ncbi:ComF family protein [Novosphingobium lentum]|uniref:ComF family protein n=1 Tax=Novosphingobium lentum TaxID=145287 RepID=UPI000A024F67|nr:ComF family protein [Novosphingobium lentum]
MGRVGILEPIVDMIFPPRCPLCGDPLARQGGFCAACWAGLAIPGDPSCALCQRPLGHRPEGDGLPEEGALVCAPCLASPPRHAGIAAATLYTDASRQLVLAFKHGRRIGLAPLLARLMLARIPPLEGDWLVVPVPLHRWRLWRRGFNQSALLARQIATALAQELAVDALVRRKRTPSLGGLNRRARAIALAGAITVNAGRRERLKGAQVLLVDDVMTSGATTDACLRALKKAGAGPVRIACFARVLDESLDHAAQHPADHRMGDDGARTKTPETLVPGVLVTK